jgi:hypothetical protein
VRPVSVKFSEPKDCAGRLWRYETVLGYSSEPQVQSQVSLYIHLRLLYLLPNFSTDRKTHTHTYTHRYTHKYTQRCTHTHTQIYTHLDTQEYTHTPTFLSVFEHKQKRRGSVTTHAKTRGWQAQKLEEARTDSSPRASRSP